MKHKVIGIITTKNRFEFLERAFASAINQSKVLHEIIISSDSDDSTSIIKEISLAEQNNISYLQNNHAHNCSGVRNAAIMAYIKNNLQSIEDFDNTYVAFLDDDDIWDEFYIEKCCEYIGSLPDFIVTGLVYQDGSGDKKLSIPQIIHTDDFLKGNPHIQGSNMFIKLTMILKCGLFDENLASSVDRDIFVRIMQLKPTYTIINEHLVYVNVCNDRKRVTNSIELKRRDLSIFFSKYANIMSEDVKYNFFSRCKKLFGIECDDIKKTILSQTKVYIKQSIEREYCVNIINQRLIVGIVITNYELGIRLIRDIIGLKYNNIKIVIVKNFKEVSEELSLLLRKSGFDYYIYDCNKTIREICTTRNILFQTLYEESDNNDIFWILDDDMQLSYISDNGDILETDIFKVISDNKDKYDAIVGDYTLDPPLPILSTLRTKLLDYVYFHVFKYQGGIELYDLRDYYYDLSERSCEHLETPFVINPSISLKEIFSGKATSRPLYLNNHEALPASNCGGNVLIFNRKLLNIKHLSLSIADNTGRRSDYFWVLESIRQGYSIKNISYATLHNRVVSEFKYEREVNKLFRDIIGSSCTKTITKVGLYASYDLLSKTFKSILYDRVTKFVVSYYRILGLLEMLNDNLYSSYFTTSNLNHFLSDINRSIGENDLCKEWEILIDKINDYEQ